MKRKIVAILAADVAGYSRLVAEDEEQTLTRLRDYQAVFSDVIKQAGGRVFKTAGDSVLAEFNSAVEALRCAINVQETLRVRNQAYPMSRQMAYRIGLTIGDVVDQDGDLLGDGVNIAARLESLAQPGGICISKAMHDAVSSKLSVKYIDMGSHQVKNIPIPVHVFSVTPDARPASSGEHPPEAAASPSRARWQPPLAVSALAVAAVSAVLAYAVPRLFDTPPKPAAKPVVAAAPQPTATAPSAPPVATAAPAASQPATPPPAPPTVHQDAPAPKSEAATPPPVTPPAQQSPEDPAAAQRLRPTRWTACNEDDTDAALSACGALATDTAITGDDLALAQRRFGYALRKKGKLDDAITALNASIATAATSAAHNDRGIAYLLKGQFAEALTDFDEAVRRDAKNGDAWNNRAWTYFKTSRNKEALADADKAVNLVGSKAYVWDTRGHIHEAVGDRRSAEADFVKALSLEPDLASSRAALKRITGR